MANPEDHPGGPDKWYAGDSVQAAIGQSDSLFTPLQLAEYCATVADNGKRHTASMLKSVRSFDLTNTIYQRQADVLNTVDSDSENWEAVHEGMRLVGADPSGSAYDTFGDYWVSVACKTGTAQTGAANNGVFICYAPFDKPQVAVAVVIEHAGAGASVAPIAKDVLDAYFNLAKSAESTSENEKQVLK